MFSLDAVSLEEIEPINLAIATDPASPFTHELRVALAPSGKRLKLHNTSLTIQPVEGEAEKRNIGTMETLRSVLTTEFGLLLPSDKRLEPALARLLPPAEAPAG